MDNKQFNELLLQKYTEELQDTTGDIPTNIADTFSRWLQGKVAEASQQLAQQAQPPVEQEAAK